MAIFGTSVGISGDIIRVAGILITNPFGIRPATNLPGRFAENLNAGEQLWPPKPQGVEYSGARKGAGCLRTGMELS